MGSQSSVRSQASIKRRTSKEIQENRRKSIDIYNSALYNDNTSEVSSPEWMTPPSSVNSGRKSDPGSAFFISKPNLRRKLICNFV